MFKKINNCHIFILILIVFILNIILFKFINITKAQWQPPSGVPGQGTANIVTNPLSANLDLGDQSIVGEGSINIYGNIGIGTIMPNYPLHIETNTELPVTDNTNHAQILLKTTGQSHGEANITLSTETILAAPWQIFVDDWSGNNIPQDALAIWKDDAVMTFRDTGDVGIGMDEPMGTLHLANGPATALYIETEGSMGNNNSAGEIYFRAELETTPEPRNFALIKAINNIGADAAAGRLDFYAAGGEGQLTDPVLSVEGYGRVGIGTIDPNKKLHIYDIGNAEIDLQSVGIAGDGNHWGIYHDGLSDDLRFWHGDDRLTITDDGNVGIGVNELEAYQALHIKKEDAGYVGLKLENTLGSSILSIKTPANTAEAIVTFNNGSNNWQIGMDNNPTTVRGDFGIGTTNNENPQFLIQADGNVGIGTKEPNKNLHIYDENNAEINLQSIAGVGNHWGMYHSSTTDDLRFWHGGENRLAITDGGAVGIGITIPPRKLSVWDGSILTQQSSNTNNYGWQIYTRGAEESAEGTDVTGNFTFHENTEENFTGVHRMTIERGGNVGIGIEDPTVKLDVSGKIQSNNAIIGQQFVGTWNGYDWTTSKSYNIPHGGTGNDGDEEFFWDFPVRKFGFVGHQGIVKLLIQDWASEYWYGLIMWKNSGGSDPIKEAFVVPIVSGQPSTPYGPPINVSVSVPNELGWSDTVVDDSPLENVVRIHFSGMWGHSHAGTIKLLFDR